MDLEDNDSTVSDDEVEPLSFRARTARVLALLAVLVIVGLWGWALFFLIRSQTSVCSMLWTYESAPL